MQNEQRPSNGMNEAAAQAPRHAFENFWYHYKWHSIAGIFIAVFLVIAIAQMAGKEPYDAHVLYTGPSYLDRETCESIMSSIIEVSDAQTTQGVSNPADYSGDGQITVDFNKYIYIPPELAAEYQEKGLYYNNANNLNARGDYNNAIMIGEYVILLIDQSLYEETVASGAFLTWEETLGYTPEHAMDDCGILLADLPIGTLNGFRLLPEDTVLCCRGKSYINNFNKKVQNEKMYKAEVALFCQMVTYTRDPKEMGS